MDNERFRRLTEALEASPEAMTALLNGDVSHPKLSEWLDAPFLESAKGVTTERKLAGLLHEPRPCVDSCEASRGVFVGDLDIGLDIRHAPWDRFELGGCGADTTCSCTSGTCGGSTCGGSTCSATCTGDSCGNTCGNSCDHTTNLVDRLGQLGNFGQLARWR